VGTAVSSGESHGATAAAGWGETVLPTGEVLASAHDSGGTSEASFASETAIESHATHEGGAAHRAWHQSRQVGEQIGHQRSSSVSDSMSDTEGANTSESHGRTRSETRGTTRGTSETRTRTPFYEYRKTRVVSSRTFLTKEEFLTLGLQRVRGQVQGDFVVKAPGHPAVFLRGPFVETPRIGAKLLGDALARIFLAPFYHRALPAADRPLLPARPLPRKPGNDEDFWE
jgi:hypothetical protein